MLKKIVHIFVVLLWIIIIWNGISFPKLLGKDYSSDREKQKKNWRQRTCKILRSLGQFIQTVKVLKENIFLVSFSYLTLEQL